MFNCIQNNTIIQANTDLLQRDDYQCPICHRELVLKSGNKKQAYFSHEIDQGCKHRDPKRPNPKAKPKIKHTTINKADIMLTFEKLLDQILSLADDGRGQSNG